MSFAYHRALAPMMWALLVLAIAEAAIVHLMIGFWYPRVALLLTAISLAFVAWLAAAITSFRWLPVILGETTLLLRAGRIKAIEVALDNVAEIAPEPSSDLIKAGTTLDLALIAHANIFIRLKSPVTRSGMLRRGPITAIAHRLDDPATFIAALRARIG